MLSEEEKRELKELSVSPGLKEDTARLLKTRYNPFIVNGKVDIDTLLTFLTEYNLFISHTPRAFHKIIDNDMRL